MERVFMDENVSCFILEDVEESGKRRVEERREAYQEEVSHLRRSTNCVLCTQGLRPGLIYAAPLALVWRGTKSFIVHRYYFRQDTDRS